MKHTRLWVAAAIIGAFVIIGFALSVPHTRDVEEARLAEHDASKASLVSFDDAFRKGVRTFSGSVRVPDACTSISAEALLLTDEAGVERIHLTLATNEDPGVCLEVAREVRFTASVEAPEEPLVSVMLDGAEAPIAGL